MEGAYPPSYGASTVIQRFHCMACGRTIDNQAELLPGMEYFVSPWPSDSKWTKWDAGWICPSHKIEMSLAIDGRKVKHIPAGAYHGLKPIEYEDEK